MTNRSMNGAEKLQLFHLAVRVRVWRATLSGTDVMIFKIFSAKNSAKKWRF
jgi:hypothetical protein